MGPNATAAGDESFAGGYNASSAGAGAVAIGSGASAQSATNNQGIINYRDASGVGIPAAGTGGNIQNGANGSTTPPGAGETSAVGHGDRQEVHGRRRRRRGRRLPQLGRHRDLQLDRDRREQRRGRLLRRRDRLCQPRYWPLDPFARDEQPSARRRRHRSRMTVLCGRRLLVRPRVHRQRLRTGRAGAGRPLRRR
ncbi:hypothetical protein FV222_20300 [Methylobacterium sp. WL103]|nr:hypothetical protein FV226_02635 [Methylobacterium sp. WL12]TXM95678.1 hypothetical protein FV222_20300 [Methylobacterium sp. WL103]